MRTKRTRYGTEQELREELERRVRLRRQAEAERRETITHALTREVVDLLNPGHDRTSCSDADRANGWGSRRGVPRCTRCALLEVLDGEFPEGHTISLTIENER